MLDIHYEIDVTFRCNAKCKWCNRLIGAMPIPDSDLTVEDVRIAGDLLRLHRVGIDMVKISGGEPLVHPELKAIYDVVKAGWGCKGKVRVLSNGLIHPKPFRAKWWDAKVSDKIHAPSTISPADLGIENEGSGWKWPCRSQNLCGRSFDAWGFSWCPFAAIVGRVIGFDPYSAYPVMDGQREVCRHCIYSVPYWQRGKIEQAIIRGEIPEATKTYVEGIVRENEKPTVLKKFKERTR